MMVQPGEGLADELLLPTEQYQLGLEHFGKLRSGGLGHFPLAHAMDALTMRSANVGITYIRDIGKMPAENSQKRKICLRILPNRCAPGSCRFA